MTSLPLSFSLILLASNSLSIPHPHTNFDKRIKNKIKIKKILMVFLVFGVQAEIRMG